jgi:hypothetical protein
MAGGGEVLQWLDPQSIDSLMCVARRLDGARVAFLLARRPGGVGALEAVLARSEITRADGRVDPAHILDRRLGEAAAIRNVGGRVTGATVQMLAMLAAVAAAEGASGGWELVLLHHTDCGITRLAQYTDLLSAYFDVPGSEVSAKAVCDPAGSVGHAPGGRVAAAPLA